MLTKYGTNNIIIMLLIGLASIFASYFSNNIWFKVILISFGILFIAFTLYFFRDPNREIPEKAINNSEYVLSPADGKIVEITEVFENIYVKEKTIRISIFLSPLDVHVNRSPVKGIVEYYKYYPGKYLVAYHPKSSELNEQSKIGVKTNHGKILFTQIVGIVARRLVCDLKIGDSLETGQKFGMMKFGSRMDVYLPTNTKLLIKENDKVIAGKTFLAELD